MLIINNAQKGIYVSMYHRYHHYVASQLWHWHRISDNPNKPWILSSQSVTSNVSRSCRRTIHRFFGQSSQGCFRNLSHNSIHYTYILFIFTFFFLFLPTAQVKSDTGMLIFYLFIPLYPIILSSRTLHAFTSSLITFIRFFGPPFPLRFSSTLISPLAYLLYRHYFFS